MEEDKRYTGRVKWFQGTWGFILLDSNVEGEAEEIFVHQNSIIMEGHRMLRDGQKVEFDIKVVPKGKQAFNVKVIEE